MVELSPIAHRVQLISGFIAACAVLAYLTISPGIEDRALTSLEKIQKRGYLKVLTINGDTTYYQDSEGSNGFEYHLAGLFADSIGVEARFITVPNFSDIYPELLFGSGDLAAAGLSENDSRYSRSVAYGPTYYSVAKQVLYRKFSVDRPRKPGDLIGGRLKVISGTAHVRQLQDMRVAYPDLTWIEVDDVSSEELIEQVDSGEIDYFITDSHTIALQRRYFPELRIAFESGLPRKLRWAYNLSEDDSLGSAIETFFEKISEDGRLQQLVHRHYSHAETFNYSDIQTFTQRIETRLPLYEALFRKEADAVRMDWRLLASIGYQESLWNERARSPTGVRGLMMLTLTTAAQMGIENRLDPAQSVHGGAKYFTRVLKKIPQRVAEPDRTWFALAAYNVGFGHLEDARKITQTRGGNPDRWIDVKENLPLLARKKWYKTTKYGYARGWEPVKYVENIRTYYDYLVSFDNRSRRDTKPPKPFPEAAPLAPSL
jgi:membrane-bound lytic murein transglycosylase F